jgi:hypothetical protein
MAVPKERTTVEGNLTATQRQANKRARDKGLPEPFVRVEVAEREDRKTQAGLDLTFATEFDATGAYYKAECRPLVELLAVYQGTDIHEKENEDEETSYGKKKKSKTNQPNPSQQKLRIKAVRGINNEPIEPSCWVGCKHTDCGRDLRKTFEVDEVVSFKRWLDLRDKARKDLFWLCRLLSKTPYHSVHQYVCDQYVPKDFKWEPEYGLEYFKEQFRNHIEKRIATYPPEAAGQSTKELYLLEQRGGYKSSIDGVDCVQWLINAPDCRIMVITAFRQLAKKRAKEIKAYFFLPERGACTSFHMLFPEFITRGVAGRSDGPLESPARVNKNFFKEDSMWFTSMESSATGDHCDILKGDDIVDLKNSADEEMRDALKDDFNSRKTDLLDPWGLVDVTGTRYFTDDMYGDRFKPNAESKRVSPFRYSCRGALVLSIEDQILYSLPSDNPRRLTLRQVLEEERGTLVFPAKNNWSKLRDMYDTKGERVFKNQQMNEATDKSDLTDFINHFTTDFLRSLLKQKDFVPANAEHFQLWDVAYSPSATSDFSVGIAAARWTLPDGRVSCAVTDAVFGKWKASELSSNIVKFAAKHPQTRAIYVEKVNGYEWLYTNVLHSGQIFGVPNIQSLLKAFDIDNDKGAKRNRIRNLELLMNDQRLNFISGSLWNDECFKQFTQFTGEPSNRTRKDDFPDVVSFMFKCILPYDVIKGVEADTNESRRQREEKRREDVMRMQYNRMHNLGGTIKDPGPPSPQGLRASDFNPNKPQVTVQPEPPRQLSPREQALAQMLKILPSRMRYRG